MVSPPNRFKSLTAESQSPHSAPASFPLSQRYDRSCIVCHRRKVRCDRQSPCSTCTRNRSLCAYPPSNTALGRVRKTTISDVASRLSSLERSITAATTGGAVQAEKTPSSGLVGSSPQAKGRVSPTILLHSQNSSQYFDELLTTRVIEEDRDKPSLLRRSADENQVEARDTLSSLMGTSLKTITADGTDKNWQPRTRGALELWRIFTQNVDPSMKILHIPTAEVLFFEAIREPEAVSKDASVTLCAVYFAAAATMEDHDTQHVLGLGRLEALSLFESQFQQSLYAADILEHPTFLLLQGLAIYLTACRTHNHGRGSWILNGLALRVAQSIGLHRDGSSLGLTPFEAEVRRRLWWHMLARDNRAAEDHGLGSSSVLPSSDTRLPQNIHDEDLYPGMEKLPPPSSGWTKMSLHIINMEITQALQRVAGLLTSATDSQSKELARQEMLGRLRDQVNTYASASSPSIPLHELTMQLALLMVHKADFITRQQLINMEHPRQGEMVTTEESIVTACQCLEIYSRLWEDTLLCQYRWWLRSYPQYHMLLYVLWHLYVKPEGPSTGRAWECVEKQFKIILEENPGHNTKLVALQRLKWRAEGKRRSSLNSYSTPSSQCAWTESNGSAIVTDTGKIGDQVGIQSVYQDDPFLPMSTWASFLEDVNIHLPDFLGT
ncbi:hypothetical protein MY8738_010155 [Beauveria namnaoensis]